MNDKRRILRAAVLAAACATVALTAVEARAFGTPTYVIYVDGPNGGTVDASGSAPAWPANACGLRITNSNLLAWYWASGYVSPNGVLDVENNGWMPPADQLQYVLEFTGQLGAGCNGAYVFHTPSTPDALVPPGAVALVMQFIDYDDIEFLDFNFQVIEPAEPPFGGGDPEPPDPCESVPEFCDIPDSFYDNPCDSSFWSEACDAAQGLGGLVLGVRDFMAPAVFALEHPPTGTAQLDSLRSVLARVSKGERFKDAIRTERRSLDDAVAARATRDTTRSRHGRADMLVDLGQLELAQCRANVARAVNTYDRDPVWKRHAARAAQECAAASTNLEISQAELQRLTAFELLQERR